jgi:hypothetical protein
LEEKHKALIVWLILNGRTEEAIARLANDYGLNPPKLKIGLPKRQKRKAVGVYSARDKTIFVLNSDALKNPFVILHEFYHHLRTTVDLKHRGTEKHADRFAEEFIQAYRSLVSETQNT